MRKVLGFGMFVVLTLLLASPLRKPLIEINKTSREWEIKRLGKIQLDKTNILNAAKFSLADLKNQILFFKKYATAH